MLKRIVLLTLVMLQIIAPLKCFADDNSPVGTVYGLKFRDILSDEDHFSFMYSLKEDMKDLKELEFFIEEDGKNINSNDELSGLGRNNEYVDFYFLKRNRAELCVEARNDSRNVIAFTAPCSGRYVYNIELHPWYHPEYANIEILAGNVSGGFKSAGKLKYVSTTNILKTGAVDAKKGDLICFAFYGDPEYVPVTVTRLDLKLISLASDNEIQKKENDDNMVGAIITVFIGAGVCISGAVYSAVKRTKKK